MTTQQTTLLIVGAGPTGLATAISLVKHGFRDFIIVDENASKGEASRAMTIHAATLEALDTIDCAEPLVELGIKGTGMQLSDRSAPFFGTEFSSLAPYTRFPFVLLLPQSTTEQFLEAHLTTLGITVLKPEKAVGLKCNDKGDLEVHFESGNTITAQYIIGADGAKSVIRQMAGVSFSDPDGMAVDERLAQMIFADVSFSSNNPYLPSETVFATGSGGKFFLVIPLPRSRDSPSSDLYRIGFNVPISAGPPPANPSTAYLQQYLNEQGPTQLSSDPSVNPNPLHISNTIWATRFRTHAAIADQFLVRMSSAGINAAERKGGIILLVGDAAHIHAPAGGLGMNLGIRDAISLGPVLARHITSTSAPHSDMSLDDYVSTRRERALATIRLTKRIMYIAGVLGSTQFININYWVLRLISRIPFIQRMMAWNLSGLGNR